MFKLKIIVLFILHLNIINKKPTNIYAIVIINEIISNIISKYRIFYETT